MLNGSFIFIRLHISINILNLQNFTSYDIEEVVYQFLVFYQFQTSPLLKVIKSLIYSSMIFLDE